MKTLELFCGTKSFSKVAEEFGYETKTLDNEDQFNADFTMDIMDFDVSMLGDYKPDIVWASPPCQKFSVASFSSHWFPNRVPKNENTVKAMDMVKKGKDGKIPGVSKDDAFANGKEIESVTESVMQTLQQMVDTKMDAIMAV